MAIENIPMFSAMNQEEVKPPFPRPNRPLTSQEAHFAIMEKVNACINEVNQFEQRVRAEMERFINSTTTENTAFKEAIQASYNAFLETVQREVNNFETDVTNNYDLFRADIDTRIANFETAINNEFASLENEFAELFKELSKTANAKIAELEEIRVTMLNNFTTYKNTLLEIVENFKTQVTTYVTEHMAEQDGKIEEYKNYMVDNILDSTETIFNQKMANGEIAEIMQEVYGGERVFKGSLSYTEIQAVSNPANGDTYYCTTDEHYYQYTETGWADVGNGDRIYSDYEAFKLNVAYDNKEILETLATTTGVTLKEIPLDYLDGYSYDDGRIGDADSCYRTDYFAVRPFEKIYVTGHIGYIPSFVIWYDKNKSFIGSTGAEPTPAYYTRREFTVPENARFAVVNSATNKTNLTWLIRVERYNTIFEEFERVVNAENYVGIAPLKISSGSSKTASGNSLMPYSITEHNATVTFDRSTLIRADKGFSVKVGTPETLKNHKIIIRVNETENFALNKYALTYSQNTWGSPYANCVIDKSSGFSVIDFDDEYQKAIEAGKITEDFTDNIFLMIYDNRSWASYTGEDENVYADIPEGETYSNSYTYYLYESADEAYLPEITKRIATLEETITTLSDTTALNERLTAIDEAIETTAQNASDEIVSAVSENNATSNVLYGKRYVACGDSFTEGDFSDWTDENGLSKKDSPVIYDPVRGTYKTYPWWIAERNGMILDNRAKCGGVLALTTEYLNDPENVAITRRNPFSHETYKNLGDNVDYITIMYGLNCQSTTTLGTIDDTTNETFYGAWNVVLKYLIETYPMAKIGLIGCNAYLKEEWRTAIKECAIKWGVGFLDLYNDTSFGATLSKAGMCSEARTIRNNQFYVASTNTHPNHLAHEYMSTYVENFMRNL